MPEIMSSVPYSRYESLACMNSSKLPSNMIGGTVNSINESCPPALTSSPNSVCNASTSPSSAVVVAACEKPDHLNINPRNRNHAKIKLLVRSHAMRESTSPPREPNEPQLPDVDKITTNHSTGNIARPKQLNNNESMPDGNIATAANKHKKQSGDSPNQTHIQQTSTNSQQIGQIYSTEMLASKNTEPHIEEAKTKPRRTNDDANCSSCGMDSTSRSMQIPVVSNLPSTKTTHGLQHSPKITNLAEQMHNNEKIHGENAKSNSTSALFICNAPCSNHCANSNNNNNNTLSVSRPGSRHKLRHRNVSQGSFDGTSPSISRDSSTELYTDSTGIDLEQFIANTLNRNQKDRTVLLRIERELLDFASDRQRGCHKFPNMSSYNRMLVHRVAAYFGMEHNVDQSGLCVVVTRTKNTRIPNARFKESIRDDIVLTEEPKRSILKRDSNSFEDNFNFKSPDRFIADYCRRSKSFEEREEEYERARRRIFKDSSTDSGEATSWPWTSSESSDRPAKPRIPRTISADHRNRSPMLLKVESFHENEPLRRPSVPKSYSFGGYAAGETLSRDDSITSTRSAGARLTKQDSGTSTCSRLSPSSSGYKSQSQRSDATISPSPSPSPVMPVGKNNSGITGSELVSLSPEGNGQDTVIWAVTNISSVPVGSVIIDPRTNLPYTNSDGSIYRFDPENPPKASAEEDSRGNQVPESPGKHEAARHFSPQKSAELHKRRSRYEKKNQDPSIFTNSATSPSLPFDISPLSNTQTSKLPTRPAQAHQHQQQQRTGGLQKPLVKQTVYNTGQQIAPHNQYTNYVPPNSQANNQGVYLMHTRASSAVTISPYPSPAQIRVDTIPQGPERGEILCCNQNPMITTYQMPGVQLGPPQTFEDVSELSGSFVGMNFYDQRAAGDAQAIAVAAQSYQHISQPSNLPMQCVQPGSSTCWQSHSSQIPAQQAMYFVPPSPSAIANGQNAVDTRQHLQRFAAAYSFNHPGTVVPTNQSAPSYVNSYSTPTMPAMQPIPGMQSPQGDFAYQHAAHVIPAYYNPAQSNLQSAPVMYGVPTPPNTPTNSQIPAVPPLMYVNSNNYNPSGLITNGTYGHQVGGSGNQPSPSYVGSALMPNVILRQAVPAITGIRTSTPSSLRRMSRSPDPGYEIFGTTGRDSNPQPQYQLPMCQGVHIVQGVAANSRLQYAPALSQLSSVAQGCGRPHPLPPYISNTPNDGSRSTIDNRSQKLWKHR